MQTPGERDETRTSASPISHPGTRRSSGRIPMSTKVRMSNIRVRPFDIMSPCSRPPPPQLNLNEGVLGPVLHLTCRPPLTGGGVKKQFASGMRQAMAVGQCPGSAFHGLELTMKLMDARPDCCNSHIRYKLYRIMSPLVLSPNIGGSPCHANHHSCGRTGTRGLRDCRECEVSYEQPVCSTSFRLGPVAFIG